MLWNALKELRQRGIRFRRQHVIGNYITDFACPSAKMVIEVDGQNHSDPHAQAADDQRDAWLNSQGYFVLRFGATDVLQNIAGVVETIVATVESNTSRS